MYGSGYFWLLVVGALAGAVIAAAAGHVVPAIGMLLLAVVAGLTALAKRG